MSSRIAEYKLMIREKAQNDKLFTVLRLTRELYNAGLEERTTYFKETGEYLNLNAQKKLHKTADYPELDRRLIEGAFERLQKSFDNFFAYRKAVKAGTATRKTGFPEPKKPRDWNSFRFWRPNAVQGKWFEGGRALGRVRVRLNRPIPGEYGYCTIVRRPSGWYLQLSCEIPEKIAPPAPNGAVGLDMGVARLVTDSDGGFWENPAYLHKRLMRLKHRQQSLHRHDRRLQLEAREQEKGRSVKWLLKGEFTIRLCSKCGRITPTSWNSKKAICECGMNRKRQDNSRANIDALVRLNISKGASLEEVSAAYQRLLAKGERLPKPQVPRLNSKRKRRLSKSIARLHENTANLRAIHHHAVSRYYTEHYDAIAIEGLDLARLVRNEDVPKMSRRLGDAALADLASKITYKAIDRQRKLAISRASLTTGFCSRCGHFAGTTFADRMHCCDHCGYQIRRQRNSAANVLAFGNMAIEESASAEDITIRYVQFLNENPLQIAPEERQIRV